MSRGNYKFSGDIPPYLNSEERRILGWMTDSEFEEFSTGGAKNLQPVQNNKAYTTPTSNSGEYYLYECRQNSGWDKGLQPGLLIYHIDKSDNIVLGTTTAATKWSKGSGINAVANHQCFDLIEAVSPESSLTDSKDQDCPFPGITNNTSFTSTTTPAAVQWNGFPTGYNLTEIAYNEGVASFNLTINSSLLGSVKDKQGNPIVGASVKLSGNGGVEEMFSNREGEFVYENSVVGVEYLIEVYAEGYLLYTGAISTVPGTTAVPVILYRPAETLGYKLQKYIGTPGNSNYGYQLSSPTYGAFSVNPSEIAAHKFAGYKVSKISFYSNETSENVEVFVMSEDGVGNKTIIYQKNVQNIRQNSLTTVDISAATISSENRTYQAGENFTFTIDAAGNETPLSKVWTFNGDAVTDGGTRNLVSGRHKVKVVITYPSGRVDTIRKVIVVN